TVGGTNTIAGVQFVANGTSIGNDTSAPYTLAWTPGAAGTYSITAVITDSTGASSTSSPRVIDVVPAGSVNPPATSPAVTLSLSPRTATTPGSTTLPSGAMRILLAEVVPSAGRAIVRVEF